MSNDQGRLPERARHRSGSDVGRPSGPPREFDRETWLPQGPGPGGDPDTAPFAKRAAPSRWVCTDQAPARVQTMRLVRRSLRPGSSIPACGLGIASTLLLPDSAFVLRVNTALITDSPAAGITASSGPDT